MAANYGVNVTVSAEAARPIAVQSNTIIGVAGSLSGLDKAKIYAKLGYSEVDEWPIVGFSAPKYAIEFIEELKEDHLLSDNRLLDVLYGMDAQAITSVVVISFFDSSDDESILANALSAVNAFKKAEFKTGHKPDLIIAPFYSHEAGIKAALESVATALGAIAITDLYATNTGDAITAMKSYSSRRLVACWPYVQVLSVSGAYTYIPQSAIIAAMIARCDGESEYGFSDSYSNRVMNGVVGSEHFVEYIAGSDCDADRLRSAHISTVINYSGYRSWGGETSDIDSIWQDLARVRIFDRISKACQDGVFYAIDRKADQLYHAKRSVEELLRALVGAKVLLGFEISWSEQNTLANITAGKFYLDIRMQNNPIVKQLTLNFIYVDSYGEVLLNDLNK
ncbi:phage tail sheath family protein [Campylobacter lanienae]|uniref:phage tail sheath family protein n=1 Tax=Campylobacter lanienae TaxID=75658 RepID=UPI000BB40EAE|nr:phage tail sheath subtilisin-like domain-containing protein [Campylobacter lanienae]